MKDILERGKRALALGLVLGLTLITFSCGTQTQTTISLSSSNKSPIIIAHRGFSDIAPENTLIAYQKAIEVGAPWAECDIFLSQDGVPFLFHDKELKRTSDGKGEVEKQTLEQLKALDAGSWKDKKYAGEKIPTLREYLELLKGKMRPVIEIKSKKPEILPKIIIDLKRTGYQPEEVTIFSFHYEQVRDIIKNPNWEKLHVTWLLDEIPANETAQMMIIDKAKEANLSALGASHKKARKDFVMRAQKAGFPIYIWTVNDEPTMVKLIEMGVDGIITDRPDLGLKTVKSNTKPEE